MMKVVHFITTIDRAAGGTSAYMQLLAKELGRLVDLHVVTHESACPLNLERCTVHYIKGGMLGLGMRREWTDTLREIRPDVVHMNCCWLPEIALAQRWSQRAGYKVVLTPHGMLEPWIMARHYWTRKFPALLLYQREAVRKADCLHATAESERENLLRLGYNTRIKVIPNGIDVDSISMKASWKRSETILFLSRVHVKKGVNFLVEAAATLRKELSGYRIVIAGEGEPTYIDELKALAEKLDVTDRVDFVGGVYGERKWELLCEADVFVLPTHSENFGIAVAEALACGTPVITTKGTPWRDLETWHCGWWTEIGTKPLEDALRRFLTLGEDELETMGRNGRRLVEGKYAARKMAEDMAELYRSIS